MQRLIWSMSLALALCGCSEDHRIINGDYPEPPPGNPEAVVQALAHAYRSQNYRLFESLLAPGYTFFLHETDPDTGETQWDRATELCIHRRMFDPENILPGDPPLPSDLWLQAVTITLVAQSRFIERPDLYTTAVPPGPLDPARWIAVEAMYSADILLALQGDTDFQVRGGSSFVVVEDRSKSIGDAGKFAIYRWTDLDGAFTRIKRPYRVGCAPTKRGP